MTAPALESSPAKPYQPPSPGSSTRRATNAGASGTWSRTSSPVAWLSSPAKPAAVPTRTRTAASAETELARKITRVPSAASRLANASRVPQTTSETRAASRRNSRLGSSFQVYSVGSDSAVADGVDARNVLPLPPSAVRRGSLNPPLKWRLRAQCPQRFPTLLPRPRSRRTRRRACALMQPFATAAMQLFGVNLALRSLDCKVPCVAEDTTQPFDANLALRRRPHRRRPGRRRLTVAMRTIPQSTQIPPNIGPTRRYV